jgi:hypothetical protein
MAVGHFYIDKNTRQTPKTECSFNETPKLSSIITLLYRSENSDMAKKVIRDYVSFNEALFASNRSIAVLLKCSSKAIERANDGTRGWPMHSVDLALAFEAAIAKAEQCHRPVDRDSDYWTESEHLRLQKLIRAAESQLSKAKSRFEGMKKRFDKAIHAEQVISNIDLGDIPETERDHTAQWLERQRVFVQVKKLRNGLYAQTAAQLSIVSLEAKLAFMKSLSPPTGQSTTPKKTAQQKKSLQYRGI